MNISGIDCIGLHSILGTSTNTYYMLQQRHFMTRLQGKVPGIAFPVMLPVVIGLDLTPELCIACQLRVRSMHFHHISRDMISRQDPGLSGVEPK